jgi:ABC-type branched-subunit amino acid transport system ATPase component/ABC-type branched-subunit amino acid transport system permease subunit
MDRRGVATVAGVVAVLLIALALLDSPRQVVFIGVVDGLSYGLLALGVVLIYRTSRVINFAVGSMGTLAASVLALAVINWGWGFWPAFALALVVGVAFAGTMELTVVTRLFKAPRVIVLVATIGIAQLAQLLQTVLPDLDATIGESFPVPFDGEWEVVGVRVTSAELIVLLAVPVITLGLTILLARTRFGKSVHAAASNPDKARLSGINPKIISTYVWAIAGGLAALTTTLLAGTSGSLIGLETLGPNVLTRVLTAALIGAMVSFPRALVGGVAIGLFQALIRFNYADQTGLVDGLLFIVVLVAVWLLSRSEQGAERESFSFAPRVKPIPERLKQLWWVRHMGKLVAGAGLVMALALPLLITEASRQFLWSRMLILALVALSLVVLTGWAGQVSLGQAAFAGIGALGTAALVRGQTLGIGVGSASFDVTFPEIPFVPSLIIMTAATTGVALMIGLGALRIRGLLLAVVTLSFALAAQQFLWRTEFFSGGGSSSVSLPRGWLGPWDLTSQRTYFYFALSLLVLGMLLVTRLRRSGIGRTIIGVRDNPDTAAAYTLSPTRAKLIAFGLAGALAGFAGGALGGLFVTVSFTEVFVVEDSIEIVSIAVIGGVGSVAGPILGSLWVVGLPAFWPDNNVIPLLTSSVGLLLLLMYFPGGLVQIGYAARDSLLAWAGSRLPEQEPLQKPARLPAAVADHAETLPTNDDGSVLSTTGMSVTFGGRTAVDDVDFRANPGEIVGLIGTNGAGKTTLLNAVGGFVPSAGTANLLGEDITDLSAARRARVGLGRTFQAAMLFPDLTVRETLQVALEARHRTGFVTTALFLPSGFENDRKQRAKAADIIDFFGLSRYADSFVSDLSTGTRRIVELAGMIALDARVLCLDEPTAGVAQRETEAFGPLIKRIQAELGATLVVIEHDMPLIMSISDRVYCLEAGQVIAEGPPSDVRNNPRVVASYLGTDERAIARSSADRA